MRLPAPAIANDSAIAGCIAPYGNVIEITTACSATHGISFFPVGTIRNRKLIAVCQMSPGNLMRRTAAVIAALAMLHASSAALSCSLNCINGHLQGQESHADAHLHGPHSGVHTCCSGPLQFRTKCNHLQSQRKAIETRAFVLAPLPTSLVQPLTPATTSSTQPLANCSAESPPPLSSEQAEQSLRI